MGVFILEKRMGNALGDPSLGRPFLFWSLPCKQTGLPGSPAGLVCLCRPLRCWGHRDPGFRSHSVYKMGWIKKILTPRAPSGLPSNPSAVRSAWGLSGMNSESD
jgi:hypothetical protein